MDSFLEKIGVLVDRSCETENVTDHSEAGGAAPRREEVAVG